MTITERLGALRALMKERDIEAYIVPTDDFHGSEYVGEYFKARQFMSGFTGSAGTLAVLADSAYLWTDGRYYLQAEDQLAGSTITLMKAGQPDVPEIAEFLADTLKEGSRIGFDGRTVSAAFVKKLQQKTAEKHLCFAGGEDLVGMIWKERPAISTQQAWELDARYAGLTREEKLRRLRLEMKQKKADRLVVTALDEIAWLLNLRGGDVQCTPVFLAYMVIGLDSAVLCVHEEILDERLCCALKEAGIEIRAYDDIQELLRQIPQGSSVLADCCCVNDLLIKSLPQGITLLDEPSPVKAMKARKTQAEMEHIRAAHRKDGVAVTKFIYWLKKMAGKERITELDAAQKIEELRKQQEGFVEPSFGSIIAYGAHGAIVHYSATEKTNAVLDDKGFCLADTGGHYLEGTTDITRTISLGDLTSEERRAYTLVLKGNLSLAAAKFPEGVTGANLDSIARMPLWEMGMDFNHGTGHGVGYLLSVHEGPQRILWRMKEPSAALTEGMVMSDEPGIYLTGKFGVRLENLLLCLKDEKNEFGQFMRFETLTFAPFDRAAIDTALLSEREIGLLNAYHESVYAQISPYLTEEERAWLREETAPLDSIKKI